MNSRRPDLLRVLRKVPSWLSGPKSERLSGSADVFRIVQILCKNLYSSQIRPLQHGTDCQLGLDGLKRAAGWPSTVASKMASKMAPKIPKWFQDGSEMDQEIPIQTIQIQEMGAGERIALKTISQNSRSTVIGRPLLVFLLGAFWGRQEATKKLI